MQSKGNVFECAAAESPLDCSWRSVGLADSASSAGPLGKRQPRQRMWGVSGPVELGVSIMAACDFQNKILEFLSTMDAFECVQRLVGGSSDIQLWFRGFRPLGGFQTQWCINPVYIRQSISLEKLCEFLKIHNLSQANLITAVRELITPSCVQGLLLLLSFRVIIDWRGKNDLLCIEFKVNKF